MKCTLNVDPGTTHDLAENEIADLVRMGFEVTKANGHKVTQAANPAAAEKEKD